MKTKASLVAELVRLKQWSQQIRECQNRPAGLTIDDWCRQQGITHDQLWDIRVSYMCL